MSVQAAAEWMVASLEREGTLYQDVAVAHISEQFGDLVIVNSNGNLGLSKSVLNSFNEMTPDAVWSRSGRFWRWREAFDLPGRQQP